jgi:glucose-6-phosphate isomerase
VVNLLKFDFTNAIGENVSNGISLEEIKGIAGKLHGFLESFRQSTPGFVKILDEEEERQKIVDFASKNNHFENFVVVGIGGSALGIQAISGALLHSNWNSLSKEERNGYPRLFVMDNVDPEHISQLLDMIEPSKTLFNVISKSGSTAETMANYLVVRGILESRGLEPRNHLVFTTDPNEGILRRISIDEDIPSFTIPTYVGGRFSVLTAVGLLSAAMVGIDINEMIAGAKEELEAFLSQDDTLKNPVLFNAALHYLYSKKGKNISVMMSYSNALYTMADWYRQLWAESLGKEKDLTGEVVNAGQTPIKSLGTIDQHSQVQLYMEGPNDKVITFLKVEKFRRDLKIPRVHVDKKALSYLGGKEMARLINSEQEATALALMEKGRPNLTISFDEITPKEIGTFFLYYELTVMAMGFLYGINPFDQPGVELGKVNTYALMEREGYEEQKEHIESLKKNLKYLVM